MGQKRTGHENLIPLNRRSKEEQRVVQAAGGRKSGEVRRRKKQLRETLTKMLSAKINPEVELQIEALLLRACLLALFHAVTHKHLWQYVKR